MVKNVKVQKITTAYTMSGSYISIEFNEDAELIANIAVSDVALLAQVGYAFSALALDHNVEVQLFKEPGDPAYTISVFNINSLIQQ